MRAEKFAAFMSDPDVVAFFAAYERDQVETMLRAATTDDDARRAASLSIKAMREFRAFITGGIAAGDRALETLKRETKPNA